MTTRLEARLGELASVGATIGYGKLAAELGLKVSALTDALERLMESDTALGHPLRAALCSGRLNDGLPARGFFLAAAHLGHDVTDPAAFVTAQRTALFNAAPQE